MAIQGFNYEEFAQNLASQAQEIVPGDFNPNQKQYVVNTLLNFAKLAGEALYNDESLNLNAEQAVFITQIIAEWSYHKSIDLVHSGILPQYWDSIMQKIAFTIFEVAKQAVIRKIPQDQLLQAVEHHVVKVYKQSIEELEQKGIIDAEIRNRAENQSNIDAMAQQAQQAQQAQMEEAQRQQMEMAEEAERKAEESRKQKAEKRAKQKIEKMAAESVAKASQGVSHKQLKMMSLALILKVLSQDKVTTILNKFDSNDSLVISQYMNMADLESHLDGDLITDCLKEMKDFLPIKKKLTKENVIYDLMKLRQDGLQERVERVIKNERPLVKRFVSQAFDGEYGELPLKIGGIITEYIEESLQ